MTRVSSARRNVVKAPKPLPDERNGPSSTFPKHIPLPEIPSDGELAFESFCLVFCVVLHGSQYLNLYRTVWWLPHSHNDQALNYYLVDQHVMAFSLVVMSRRFPVALLRTILWYTLPSRWYRRPASTCRSCVLSAVGAALLWCAYKVCLQHGASSAVALAYPAVIYVALFGAASEPLAELLPGRCDPPASSDAPPGSESRLGADGETSRRRSGHACSGNPAEVRAEVGALRWDLNQRLKRALFCALLVAYYAAFLPCCFLQNELHLDLQWVVQHGLFAWCGALTLHACFCFPPRYLDALHRAALHLGRWRRLEARNVHAPHHPWSENVLWPQNSLVKHNREYFRSEGVGNAAEPGCGPHHRFYTLFHDPTPVPGVLLAVQTVLVAFQFYVLVRSAEWNRQFTLVALILLNCVTLFKLTRQYLVTGKIYSAEKMLQERLGG